MCSGIKPWLWRCAWFLWRAYSLRINLGIALKLEVSAPSNTLGKCYWRIKWYCTRSAQIFWQIITLNPPKYNDFFRTWEYSAHLLCVEWYSESHECAKNVRYWDTARYSLIVHRKFCEFGTELLSNTVVVENIGSRGVNDFHSGTVKRGV